MSYGLILLSLSEVPSATLVRQIGVKPFYDVTCIIFSDSSAQKVYNFISPPLYPD